MLLQKIRKRITQLKSRFAPRRLYQSLLTVSVQKTQLYMSSVANRPKASMPWTSSLQFPEFLLHQSPANGLQPIQKIAGAKSQVLRYHANKTAHGELSFWTWASTVIHKFVHATNETCGFTCTVVIVVALSHESTLLDLCWVSSLCSGHARQMELVSAYIKVLQKENATGIRLSFSRFGPGHKTVLTKVGSHDPRPWEAVLLAIAFQEISVHTQLCRPS